MFQCASYMEDPPFSSTSVSTSSPHCKIYRTFITANTTGTWHINSSKTHVVSQLFSNKTALEFYLEIFYYCWLCKVQGFFVKLTMDQIESWIYRFASSNMVKLIWWKKPNNISVWAFKIMVQFNWREYKGIFASQRWCALDLRISMTLFMKLTGEVEASVYWFPQGNWKQKKIGNLHKWWHNIINFIIYI